jgi:hypothetical protein
MDRPRAGNHVPSIRLKDGGRCAARPQTAFQHHGDDLRGRSIRIKAAAVLEVIMNCGSNGI